MYEVFRETHNVAAITAKIHMGSHLHRYLNRYDLDQPTALLQIV